MKEIPYRGSYKKFIFQIGVSFNSGTKKRLYKLMPGAIHAERTEIKSTADLEAALEWIDKNVDNNDESLQILYLYPEDSSPNSSPLKSSMPIDEPNEPDKSDSSSKTSKSEKNTNQKRFKKELLRRYGNNCLVCSQEDTIDGCHIIDDADDEEKLSEEQQNFYGLYTQFEKYNGLILCANCHRAYDKLWSLGIDQDGCFWKKVDGEWTKGKCIFPDDWLEKAGLPHPKILDWKFQRFLQRRDKISTKITRAASSMAAMFISPRKVK